MGPQRLLACSRDMLPVWGAGLATQDSRSRIPGAGVGGVEHNHGSP